MLKQFRIKYSDQTLVWHGTRPELCEDMTPNEVDTFKFMVRTGCCYRHLAGAIYEILAPAPLHALAHALKANGLSTKNLIPTPPGLVEVFESL